MGKRKRSPNDSDTECERIIGLKNWEFNNEIETLALEKAFSNDERLTYLNLYLRLQNAKMEEYTNIGQKFSKKKGFKQWRENLSNVKKYAKIAIFKTQTMIEDITENQTENEEEIIE
jgi:hypothetical protein